MKTYVGEWEGRKFGARFFKKNIVLYWFNPIGRVSKSYTIGYEMNVKKTNTWLTLLHRKDFKILDYPYEMLMQEALLPHTKIIGVNA